MSGGTQTVDAGGTGAGATGTTGSTGPAGGGGAGESWYHGADQETLGYLQNRGLDKKTAKEAAFESAKAHREAEKLIGAPANEIIRLPKDGNDPAWRSIYHRLGVPQDVKGYDFKDVKFSDGEPLNPKFAEFLGATFHKANVSTTGALEIAREVTKYIESVNGENGAEEAANIAKDKDLLVKNWGANFNANMLIADRAAQSLGISEDVLTALKDLKGVGHAKVLEMFHTLGQKMGEDKFIRGGGGDNSGTMTVPQAQATLDGLKSDKAWVEKFNARDSAAVRQFNDLTTVIASGRAWEP